jgi:hypothetical protein
MLGCSQSTELKPRVKVLQVIVARRGNALAAGGGGEFNIYPRLFQPKSARRRVFAGLEHTPPSWGWGLRPRCRLGQLGVGGAGQKPAVRQQHGIQQATAQQHGGGDVEQPGRVGMYSCPPHISPVTHTLTLAESLHGQLSRHLAAILENGGHEIHIHPSVPGMGQDL